MWIILSIVFFILSCILGYTVYNLLQKVELYEDDISYKEEYLTKLTTLVSESDSKLREIDSKGTFESDDEVGFFFKELKKLQLNLSVYAKGYEKNSK